jgi:hypothetical protein
MTHVPSWAKTIGALVLGVIVLAGSFVNRVEYGQHVDLGAAQTSEVMTELRDIRRDVKDILWRVGGRRDASFEQSIVDRAAMIESAWQDALRRAALTKKERRSVSRPPVTFHPSRYFIRDVRGRLCGQYIGWYEKDGSGWRLVVEVSVYADGEAQQALTLRHEFSHHLWYYLTLNRPGFKEANPDSEAWVVGLFPGECAAA